jgi:sugar phosphate isomerase/epimerase
MKQPTAPESRLSLNQATIPNWGIKETAEGCARAGIPWMGLWRNRVSEIGVEESARAVRDAGVKVSSLCRGGMFPAATESERRARIDDNRRAIEEAVALGTDLLVLVCGAAPGRDLDAARGMVEAGIEQLIPYALEAGVKLGVEPLHPVFAADRSVIVTLGQANDIVERLGTAQVGVVLDVFHVWWDPNLYAEIGRAAGRIFGFHLNDWLVARKDPFLSRGMMGDGKIDLRRIIRAVEEVGYDGPFEVEILNETIWSMPSARVVETVRQSYLDLVSGISVMPE